MRCHESPLPGGTKAAMAGVSVTQSEQDPDTMVVTLAEGAALSVAEESSRPDPANAEAEALLSGCP